MKNPLIVFLTDFGWSGIYLGVVKGAILSINPELRIFDLCHDVQPHNIRQAAFLLKTSYTYFPNGTIFLSVVDPGVGSERKPIAVKTRNYYYVNPDNGLLSFVLEEDKPEKIVVLDKPQYFRDFVSSTCHARDIFGPVAAHLSTGADISKIGSEIHLPQLVHLQGLYSEVIQNGLWQGEIIHIDRFGNLVTSINQSVFLEQGYDAAHWTFRLGDMVIKGLHNTYSNVQEGHFLAYIGSSGFLEIGVRDGNAAATSKATLGKKIRAEYFDISNK
jgi:S-adenosyl-L-methionine hydrolase (adenosine-forming)